MSIYETSITNPRKQLEFYKDLSEQLQQENKQLKKELEYTIGIIEHNRAIQKYILKERALQIQISVREEEYKKLENNWNKLKEYISKNIIYDDVGMKILDPSPLEDKIVELERGVSDVED